MKSKLFNIQKIITSSHYHIITLILLFTLTSVVRPQTSVSQGISINTSGLAADVSAILDVSSTSQGLLIPRMTTLQRNGIGSPATSLLIFNITNNCFEAYVNSSWYSVSCPPACSPPDAPSRGTSSPSKTQIVWNWNTVNGAAGYKWGTTTAYASASDLGTNNSYTQTGLTCNTIYTIYIWAYNSCNNSSVSVLTDTTSGCGPQCRFQTWAESNINSGTRISQSVTQTANTKWCINDIEANCTTYGGLYQWASVMNISNTYNSNFATPTLGSTDENCDPCGPTKGNGGVQGICPSGFHVPSDLEWSRYEWCLDVNLSPIDANPATNNLTYFQTYTSSWRGSTSPGVGPGDKLKGGGTAMWGNGDTGTNSSGFNALPGSLSINGNSGPMYAEALFWTDTETSNTSAWGRDLNTGYPQSARTIFTKSWGFSIRCLKD
jgi:uncharacterized protein (TIGR02145 family)